ncbi:DoxX family protein [Bacteroidales bacterium OttesenSCG-928-K03]|nr:DoxX family protein [Odoribacter sp. OttesenSCG-928-L07]MDL2242685.1 DoxX family protein [Bacteroidales bacterium OttesenSCG-928-K03]
MSNKTNKKSPLGDLGALFKKPQNKKLSLILRIIVGLVFIASAVLKFISIDIFDLYVYEHNLFSISVTETLSRLLITAEFVLGIMLIFGIYFRFAYYVSIIFLSGFTIYLFLLPYLFDVDISNCHCFGEAIIFTRNQSIIKNIVLLICLLFISPNFFKKRKWETWVLITLSFVSLIVVFVINAPNYLYTLVHKDKININTEVYDEALLNSGACDIFNDGKQIICMYSTRCEFCRKSAMKLNLILKNNNLSNDNVKAIFWAGVADSTINNFFVEQNVPIIEYTSFRVDTFLMVTNGKIPIILFSDNGNIVGAADYISLNEKNVVEFLYGRAPR